MSEAKPARRRLSWPARLTTLAVAAYGAGLLAVLILLRVAVDRHWIATLIAFGPRWVFALPLPPLILAALIFRRVLLIHLGVLALVLVVSVLDLSLGLSRDDRGEPIRVITQNLGAAMKLDDPRFRRLLDEAKPDVVFIEECWRDEEPKGSPDPAYHLAMDYTLCVLSKFPVTRVSGRPRKDVWERGGAGEIGVFELATPHGPVFAQVMHLETARDGFEAILEGKLGGVPRVYENIELRRWESQIATEWLAQNAKAPLLVAGDLNMPVESSIYKEFWGGYGNAWSRCGRGFGHTKRSRKLGARIDHVLFDDRWGCADAALAPDIGSDHRGVIVDLRLLPAGS